MKSTEDKYRWWKWLLAGSFGVSLGCAHTEGISPDNCVRSWPAEAPATDRDLVLGPMALQARNGAVVEATLFNYQFRPDYEDLRADGSVHRRPRPLPTADLLPAGINLIQRLARQQEYGCSFVLYVQTANEIPPDPRRAAEWAKKRKELNLERVKSVEAFVAMIRPDLVPLVNVIDIDEAGMSGTEAAKGVGAMIDNTHGILRPDTYDPRSGGLSAGNSSGPPPASPQPDVGSAPGGLTPGGD